MRAQPVVRAHTPGRELHPAEVQRPFSGALLRQLTCRHAAIRHAFIDLPYL